jgi:UTP--glucose-1-phosphate uridylyltransferase
MNTSRKVRKAIIPAAGLGTRFLPATKTVPKEMLTIVDAPIILFVVEEAVRAGIEDIVLIAGRGKTAIEDYFDISYELESKLAHDNKLFLLDRLVRIRERTNIISIRQKQPLGLGHAVLCGKPVVGDEPFAVLLGDEIMIANENQPTVTQQLTQIYEKTGKSAVAVMEVPPSEVSKYGIIDGQAQADGTFIVKNVIEKPKVDVAPSRWALPGRYVFSAKILDFLSETKPGVNGEIQLTDAMVRLAQSEGLLASKFVSERFDAGDKFGYLQANMVLALRSPELGSAMREYILKTSERLKNS